MRITHADVVRVIRHDHRNCVEPAIADSSIVAAFDSARGLIGRIRKSAAERGEWSFDREAFDLLINRKTPPAYIGDTLTLAFVAELLEVAEDLHDSFAIVAGLRVELQASNDEIAALKAAAEPARRHFRDGGA